MADESNSYRDVLSRRRFVELTGVSGAAALAGCSGDGGGDGGSDGGTEGGSNGGSDGGDAETTTSGGDGGMEVLDFALSNWTDDNPTEVHFNRYNTTNGTDFAHFLTFEPTAKWDYANGEFQMWAITDWEMVDDTTFEMSLNTDITWSNGDSFTSQDLATQFRLSKLNGLALWDFADSIETPDDSTLRMNLPDGANPQLIKIFLEGIYTHTKHSEFKQYLSDVEGDKETYSSAIQSETIKQPVTNGPFTSPDYNQQRMLLSRDDGYFKSGNVNFSEYEMRFIQGNQQVWQELLGESIDTVWSLFTPPRIVADFPDSITETAIPAYWGYGLVPQHDNKHLGQKKFRQALMHVLNRQQIVNNAGPRSKKTPEIPSIFPVSQVDNWIGDSKDQFESYGQNSSNTDQATQLLNDLGYSKEGGTWVDPDGETVSLPVMVPAGWSDWVSAAQTVADQLSQFGFDASVDAQGGSFWTNLPQGNFTLASFNWIVGGVSGSHPYFNARWQWLNIGATAGYNYETSDETEQQIQDLARATDQSEINSIVMDLAQKSNQNLPVLPVAEKLDQSFVSSRRLSVPEDGSDAYQTKWPQAWLVRNGEIQADPQ